MRLSQIEIDAIKNVFQNYNKSTSAELFLFGSRTDQSKRGGDIDLLILFENQDNLQSFLRLDFLVDLKKKIGDRKIDLTLALRDELNTNPFLSSLELVKLV